jgi:5-methylcytosine-specific restriction endonuclease McrA
MFWRIIVSKNEYFQKYRDPRWKKKRLEIIERDKGICQYCDYKVEAPEVHHKMYCGDPWETPNKYLVTLCEDCHYRVTKYNKEIKKILSSLDPDRVQVALLLLEIVQNKKIDRAFAGQLYMSLGFGGVSKYDQIKSILDQDAENMGFFI